MMTDQPILSLCMPTNGVIEWVFPVLDSIYSQSVDESLYEIIITDNGDNRSFKSKILEYISNHKNIVYAETKALPFINEIESYKKASGKMIKFVNHRTKLVPGALEYFIKFAKDNYLYKPIVYFSNGVLDLDNKQYCYDSFDDFVKNLSYWSSWSTGMAIWKDDFDNLPRDVSCYNELFPHTTVLFNERNREKYIIDNSILLDEIVPGKKPKGKYDFFFAFGVEYPWIICTLLRDKAITKGTYKYVLDKNLGFIADMYFSYCVRKWYCSYDVSGINNIFGIFYSKHKFNRRLFCVAVKRAFGVLLRKRK